MYMGHRVLLCVSLGWLLSLADGDPCNTNFGGCDKVNGLCWGTGVTTHFCSCKAGFEQDTTQTNHTCKDIDECAENVCRDHADCANSIGSYTCTCRCGYVKDYTGERCLNVYDISDSCYVPKACYHPRYSFLGRVYFDPIFGDLGWVPIPHCGLKVLNPRQDNTCSCKLGFRQNACGYCTDINECTEGTHACNWLHGICTNTEGSYVCSCQPGYTLGPCRRSCYGTNTTVPSLCNTPNLSSLNTSGTVSLQTRSFVRPLILSNWRTCAPNVTVGQTVTESFDVDGDGKKDVTLTWSCVRMTTGENNATTRFSALSLFSEKEAKWDSWSCWSVCKATCWGGVQTRTRHCLHGRPGIGGCKGHGTEKRECYTGTKCPFRIRKDITNLTATEVADLLQAMEKYKADTSVRGFHHAAASHGWPFQCARTSCCPHGAKMRFVTWHRTIMLNFEEGLVRYLKNKQLGIPYWSWLSANYNPPALIWNKTMNGRANPFANMTVLIDRTGPMRTIQRNIDVDTTIMDFAQSTWRDTAKKLMKIHLMHEFAEALESSHNGPHTAVCSTDLELSPVCSLSLGVLSTSAFDPIFLAHHSQVDRMWAMQQAALAKTTNVTWTKQTVMEAFEDPGDFGRMFMPFGNKTINSFPIVQNTGNMRDSYYYQELTGIKYDTLEEGGVEFITFRMLAHRPIGAENLFVAQYFHNVDVNTYINYYLNFDGLNCVNLTRANYVGRAILLATDRPYRNSIPNLVLIPSFNRPPAIEDLPITACYTGSVSCLERCPVLTSPRLATLPTAGLLYQFPNQPVDTIKYLWSTGNRMPQWNINVFGGTQWIYFYGDRVNNIFQVRNLAEWFSCNARFGRRVPCSGQVACMLPVGIYYLIDNDATSCNNGLRMIISSKK